MMFENYFQVVHKNKKNMEIILTILNLGDRYKTNHCSILLSTFMYEDFLNFFGGGRDKNMVQMHFLKALYEHGIIYSNLLN